MLIIILSTCGVVAASFLCSMAEAALLSMPLLRARMLVEEKRPNAGELLYVKENIAAAVATIVIINNSINIAGSIFIGHEIGNLLGDAWLGAGSAVLTFVIIIFGEVIPKAIGERFKIPLALFFAVPVKFLLWFLRPVVWLADAVARPWHHGDPHRVTEEEIKMMLKVGRDSGTVEIDEEILINRVFRLNDLRAIHIMKPLNEAYMLPGSATLGEAKDLIIMSPYNRLVVYGGEKTHITGIVEHRVLLREMVKANYASKISDWMLAPICVNQMIKGDVLIEKFRASNQHLFIVQDNHGHNIGLVTLEDVFEELVGEIYDEKDVRFRLASPKGGA